MIKVQIGDITFICDTPREAMELAELNSSKRRNGQENRPKVSGYDLDQKAFFTEPGPQRDDPVTEFVNKLKMLQVAVVGSGDMQKLLEAKSVNGVGPKLNGMSKRFKEVFHIPLDSVLEREGRPGQPVVWRINRNALESIDLFQ